MAMSGEQAARLRRMSRRVDQAQAAARAAESLARGMGPAFMPALHYAQLLGAARHRMEVPADLAALVEEARRVTGPCDGHHEGG